MLDPTPLSLYLAALVAVFLAPGPDMALVVATAGDRGTRAGLRAGLGIACARYAHVLAAGLGLATLLATHPALHTAVRAVGAAYLLWLAWKMLRATPGRAEAAAGPSGGPGPDETAQGRGKPRADMLRGFLTNLLNPKALLFCGLLLPQFVAPERGPLLPQFLFLGGILVGVGLLFDAAYSLLASGLVRRLRQGAGAGADGKMRLARRWLMGSVFAALAARLALG
ncbi:MAG: LysE family translocator [Humidesulfovibrio sp.]|nr:LysE family translocator [Humidesulfovibrio sp.]